LDLRNADPQNGEIFQLFRIYYAKQSLIKFRSWVVGFTGNKSTFAFERNIAMSNLNGSSYNCFAESPSPRFASSYRGPCTRIK